MIRLLAALLPLVASPVVDTPQGWGPAGPSGRSPIAGADRQERIEALHAHRLVFDPHGEPLVTVGLAEHESRFELGGGSTPLEVLPEGEEQFRVVGPPGTRWLVTVEKARPAKLRHWTLAERFTARGFPEATAARRRFSAAGLQTGVFESGALAGMPGHLFDTRTISLVVGPGATPAEAQAQASAARRASFVVGEPFVEVVSRAGGLLVARDTASGYEVRGRDLLWFRPAEGALTEIRIPGSVPRQHAGELYVTIGPDGKLVLGNLAAVETLLEGVVPSETFVTAPAEALKAQAVAARGQFMAKLGLQHRDDPFMLCNQWHCQADGGQGRATPATSAAVRATRGEMVAGPNGGLVDTVYHSDCGGHTESWEQVWGGESRTGLGGVDDRRNGTGGNASAEALLAGGADDAWCAPSGGRGGVHRWTAHISGAALTQAAQRLGRLGPVIDLRIVRRGRSGRVLKIEVVGREGREVVEGDGGVRRLLGWLKSTLFVISRDGPPGAEPTSWTIHGIGYGHGVGLCQHGAIGMANAGKGYRDILKHYFPGTHLEKAW